MSKKKSYMDRENILSEGFFDQLKDYWKFIKTHGKKLSKDEKKLLANPKARKAYKKWIKSNDDLKKKLNQLGFR